MVIWFATLAVLGLNAIIEFPSVLYALNPYYGFWMFVDAPWVAFFALGAIVLCVTGVESLYADMGHFGPQPIRYAWLGVALPALVLNYFGQAAAINPFCQSAISFRSSHSSARSESRVG